MSKSNLKLAAARSPERQALAEAIERHEAALDSVRRVNQAHKESREVAYRASDALKVAETAVEKAQADGNARLAAAALGEIDGPSTADLEAAVAQATNDLSIARRTRDALAQRAQREAAEVEGAERKVDAALRAVLASECSGVIDALMSEGNALRAQLRSKTALVRFLKNHAFESWPPNATPQLVTNFLSAAVGDQWSDNDPACAPWAEALSTLRTDADAPLPV